VAFVHLSQADVVRHRIVREIVNAYDRYAAAQAGITIPGNVAADSGPAAAQAGPIAHVS
jgi:hypothetical protein